MSSPNADMEQSLLSLEKLDRLSPDLWPEQLPGLTEFAAVQSCFQSPVKTTTARNPKPKWLQHLSSEDMNLLQGFGSMTAANLIEEVRKLQNLAYQLGLEEAKEMTRGRYLNVLAMDPSVGKKKR